MIFSRSLRTMWCCKDIILKSSSSSWCFMYERATVPYSMSTVHSSNSLTQVQYPFTDWNFLLPKNPLSRPTRKGRATWYLGRCFQIPGSGAMNRLAPTWRNHPYINLYGETILGVWRYHPVFRILMMDPYQGKGRYNNIPHQVIYSVLWDLWFIFNHQVLNLR